MIADLSAAKADGLWVSSNPLVLASGSATRRMLLESAGVAVRVHASDVDERIGESGWQCAGESHSRLSLYLALVKASAVSAASPDQLVLGADQTLACEGQVYSKPLSKEDAARQLRTLAGRTHVLTSSAVIICNGSVLFETSEQAFVSVRHFSDEFLDTYIDIAGTAVLESVGAYQIEGLGIHLFERVVGDHATILGLPLLSLLTYFRSSGAIKA